MSDHTHETRHIPEKLNAFFSTYRIALIVIAVVVIVVIVASVLLAQWFNQRNARSDRAAEEIEALWEEWTAEQPLPTEEARSELSDEAKEIESQLRSMIATIRNSYGGTYGAVRARLILGLLEWDLQNYDTARRVFEDLAADQDGTYLRPIALANAAASAEEAGDIEGAQTLYTQVVELQNVPNSERAHALFSLGRLAEATEDHPAALESYNRLLDEHGDSNWTNLGRNRIIWLVSQGVVGAGD